MDRTAITAIPHPAFYSHGFSVAPHYTRFYPHLSPWPHHFAFEAGYYDHHYGLGRDYSPAREILERAIPEGVIDDGGQVAGFLYFETIEPDLARIAFTMVLVDAMTEETFGMVRIPFQVKTDAGSARY